MTTSRAQGPGSGPRGCSGAPSLQSRGLASVPSTRVSHGHPWRRLASDLDPSGVPNARNEPKLQSGRAVAGWAEHVGMSLPWPLCTRCGFRLWPGAPASVLTDRYRDCTGQNSPAFTSGSRFPGRVASHAMCAVPRGDVFVPARRDRLVLAAGWTTGHASTLGNEGRWSGRRRGRRRPAGLTRRRQN